MPCHRRDLILEPKDDRLPLVVDRHFGSQRISTCSNMACLAVSRVRSVRRRMYSRLQNGKTLSATALSSQFPRRFVAVSSAAPQAREVRTILPSVGRLPRGHGAFVGFVQSNLRALAGRVL